MILDNSNLFRSISERNCTMEHEIEVIVTEDGCEYEICELEDHCHEILVTDDGEEFLVIDVECDEDDE